MATPNYYKLSEGGFGFLEDNIFKTIDLATLAADVVKGGTQDPLFAGLSPNVGTITGSGAAAQLLRDGGKGTVTEGELAGLAQQYLKQAYNIDLGSLPTYDISNLLSPGQYRQPGDTRAMIQAASLADFQKGLPAIGQSTVANTQPPPGTSPTGGGQLPGQTIEAAGTTTPPVGTAGGQTQITPVPFKAGLDNTQKLGIQNLVLSGRVFNETDAKNYAYATGQTNWQQFVGKSGEQILGTTAYQGKSAEQVAQETAAREAGYAERAAAQPPTSTQGETSFKAGLSDAQKQSIQNLLNKPVDQWTETDKKNWNYATNNAPLPKGPTGGATPPGAGGVSEVAKPEEKGEPPSAGVTAIDVLDYLGVSNSLTESDVTNQALMSPEFQLLLDRINARDTSSVAAAEVLKQALETKFAGDKSNLEQKLSEVGLTFSGIRATQVKALADDLAASELAVDRKLASQLMDSNFDLKEAIMNIASDIIKDASKGREEAIAQLNKAGLAVVGNQLIPTLESQRQTLSAEMDAAKFELEQAKFVLSKAKTTADIEEANRRIDLAEREYQLSVSREQRLGGGGTSGTITGGLSEIDVLAKSYLAGESLGNIGLKRGAVLLRAEEIQREELLNQMSDPEFLAMQIDEAQAKGEVFQDTLQDLRALGVPEESIRAAVKFRIDKTNYEQQNTGFFRRLFSF